jgi:hypothetical protein
VEEMLRYLSPTTFTGAWARVDVDVEAAESAFGPVPGRSRRLDGQRHPAADPPLHRDRPGNGVASLLGAAGWVPHRP